MSRRDGRTGVAQRLLWGVVWLALCAAGACSKTNEQSGESNTNWLRICIADEDCGEELSCVCGACTVECEQTATCSERDVATSCEPVPESCGAAERGGAARVSVCLAQCTGNDECGGVEDGVCRAGVCARRVRSACPAFEAGVQTPVEVEAGFERSSEVGQVGQGLVDDTGVYYFGGDGELFGLPHGTETPVMLRAAPEQQRWILTLISDATTLYWTEALAPVGVIEPGPPPPPSWLYAAPKAGGEATEVFASDEDVLYALAVTDDSVIVRRDAASPTLEAVAKDGSAAAQIAVGVPAADARVIEGKLYWTVPWEGSSDEDGYLQDLYRAALDGSAPELLTRIENAEYLAGGGYVLWKQERTHFDPLVLDQNWVMFDERSGCVQPLPGLGLSISSDARMDGRHVYWRSFNGLGGFTMGEPPDPTPLVRVDLRSGALERLVTPGFAGTVVDDVVGQTEDALFVAVNEGGLVVVQK